MVATWLTELLLDMLNRALLQPEAGAELGGSLSGGIGAASSSRGSMAAGAGADGSGGGGNGGSSYQQVGGCHPALMQTRMQV